MKENNLNKVSKVSGKKVVVFLIASYERGGMETVLNKVARDLLEQGVDVVYILGKVHANNLAFPDGVKIHVVGDYIEPSDRTALKLASSIVKCRKKLISLSEIYRGATFVAADMFWGWLSVSVRLKPLYLWLHSSITKLFTSSRTWRVNRRLFRHVDKIVVLGKSMQEEISDLLGPSMLEKTVVIPNPLSIISHDKLYAPGSKRFIYVGRLDNKSKRIDRILKAFSTIKDESWKLVIIGDGPHREYLMELAESLGVNGNIDWAGWQSDPWKYVKDNFGGVEALLLTSDYEGYGMVLVEAMANGIPCVAVDCPVGPGDIIHDGVNGVLIPLTSDEQIIKDLSDVLKEVLEGKFVFDEDKIKASVADHDPSAVVQKWIELIEGHES